MRTGGRPRGAGDERDEVVIVNARVAVIGRLPKLRAEPERAESRGPVTPTRRRVYLGDWTEVPVYKLDGLPPGLPIKGGSPVSARS